MGDRGFAIVLVALTLLCIGGAVLVLGAGPEDRRASRISAGAPEQAAVPGARRRATEKKAKKAEPRHPLRMRRPSRFSRAAQRKRRELFATTAADGAFTRLGEPDPGDWLYAFAEKGQTFAEYQRLPGLNRKSMERKTLHLLPFTDLSAQQRRLLPILREYLAIFFDTEVKVLPPETLPRSAYVARRRQYHAGALVLDLAQRVKPSSLGLFGLTGRDLYAKDLNFVFGLALLTRRAGMYSVHRYGRRFPLLLRRTLKLAAHEIGHMFGLHHCVFYKCTLNGTNSLTEMARQPLSLCPVCHEKLAWNLHFDARRRYAKLAAFYRRHGLKKAARFAAQRAEALAQRR